MSLTIDISVEGGDWAGVTGLDDLVERSAAAAVAEAGLGDAEAELSVLLGDDAAIRTLNREWRGQDKATNVLSFPAPAGSPQVGLRLLGDIAVAFETTRREAGDEGKTMDAHLSHLIVHGVLHLLNYDHEEDAAADAMEAMERRALARLGFADPYAGLALARTSAP